MYVVLRILGYLMAGKFSDVVTKRIATKRRWAVGEKMQWDTDPLCGYKDTTDLHR